MQETCEAINSTVEGDCIESYDGYLPEKTQAFLEKYEQITGEKI